MHTLILLALLQAPAGDSSSAEARAIVVKGLDALSGHVDTLERRIMRESTESAKLPRTGFAVESSPDVGTDGLHAITVKTVIQGSPAEAAGIRPRDRIVSVGSRRIEHEPSEVFRMMTDGTAGPLAITLRRGDDAEQTVTVDRQPLACLQSADARIDRERWRHHIADLRTLISIVRADIDDTSSPEVPRYQLAMRRYLEITDVFRQLLDLHMGELLEATQHECTFLTAE